MSSDVINVHLLFREVMEQRGSQLAALLIEALYVFDKTEALYLGTSYMGQ